MENEQQLHKKLELGQGPFLSRDSVRNEFKNRLVELRDTYYSDAEQAGEVAKSADGPMQSRHDTTKKEQSWLANAFGDRGDLVNTLLANWEEIFEDQPGEEIGIGSLILLEDTIQSRKDWFFLVPFNAGGLKVSVEEVVVQALNSNSLLGNSINGKTKGETVSYKPQGGIKESQEFRILKVL